MYQEPCLFNFRKLKLLKQSTWWQTLEWSAAPVLRAGCIDKGYHVLGDTLVRVKGPTQMSRSKRTRQLFRKARVTWATPPRLNFVKTLFQEKINAIEIKTVMNRCISSYVYDDDVINCLLIMFVFFLIIKDEKKVYFLLVVHLTLSMLSTTFVTTHEDCSRSECVNNSVLTNKFSRIVNKGFILRSIV